VRSRLPGPRLGTMKTKVHAPLRRLVDPGHNGATADASLQLPIRQTRVRTRSDGAHQTKPSDRLER